MNLYSKDIEVLDGFDTVVLVVRHLPCDALYFELKENCLMCIESVIVSHREGRTTLFLKASLQDVRCLITGRAI